MFLMLDLFLPFTLTYLCDMIMSSPADVSVDIRSDFNSFDHFPSMRYIATDRPWLSKYTWSSHLNWSIELAVCLSFSMLTEQWPLNISFFCATERLTTLYLLVSNSLTELYGIRVQPMPPFRSLSCKPDPALIHHCLPDELLLEVMVIWTEEYLFSFS